jgi:predicted enzyme related to lactoylglutathione lyase
MGKVIGVGGVFMTCADAGATKDWYGRVLGIEPDEHGGFSFLHADSAAAFPQGARTIFAPFDAGGDYFAPSTLPFMLNLIVDDLDALLARCEAEGVAQVQPMEAHDYGRFAWIMDPDGRKIELWQPPS